MKRLAKAPLKTTPIPNFIVGALGVLFVFVAWYLLSLFYNTFIFPEPWVVFGRLFQTFTIGRTYLHIGATILRLIIAIIISTLLALIFGTIAGLHQRFYIFFKPLMTVLKSLPTAVVILVAITLIKIDYMPVIIVSLIVFPLIYEAVFTGISSIDPLILSALRLEGENAWKSIIQIRIPLAMPYLFLAIVQAFGLGMKVIIMSEVIAGSSNAYGLGFALKIAYEDANYVLVYAYAVVAVILSLLFEYAARTMKKSAADAK